jgi:hypothetical protein
MLNMKSTSQLMRVGYHGNYNLRSIALLSADVTSLVYGPRSNILFAAGSRDSLADLRPSKAGRLYTRFSSFVPGLFGPRADSALLSLNCRKTLRRSMIVSLL